MCILSAVDFRAETGGDDHWQEVIPGSLPACLAPFLSSFPDFGKGKSKPLPALPVRLVRLKGRFSHPTASGIPPALEPIAETPQAAASKNAIPKPSWCSLGLTLGGLRRVGDRQMVASLGGNTRKGCLYLMGMLIWPGAVSSFALSRRLSFLMAALLAVGLAQTLVATTTVTPLHTRVSENPDN